MKTFFFFAWQSAKQLVNVGIAVSGGEDFIDVVRPHTFLEYAGWMFSAFLLVAFLALTVVALTSL